jgi:hypothetical protein
MLYRLTNCIYASVIVERLNCRFDLDLELDLVRKLREGRPRLQVRRLKQSSDGSIDLFVSPPICDVVVDWCRRAPQIPQLLQRNAQLTTQTDPLQWSCGYSRGPMCVDRRIVPIRRSNRPSDRNNFLEAPAHGRERDCPICGTNDDRSINHC